MKKISYFVGKMPFAGKSVVENVAMSAYAERTSLHEKGIKCARSAGFIACFAGMHALQAKMGVADLIHDTNSFVEKPNMVDGTEVLVSSAYTLAQAAVSYTQFQIAGRVAGNYFHFRDAVQEGHGLATHDREYTHRSPTAKEILYTIAGQMIFAAQRDS